MIIEICANSFESAKAAQLAGADRIELCSELAVGGLTPSHGLLQKVCDELSIPVHVLIRPRSGNFIYTDAELDVMLRDISFCKKVGVAGIVSGMLTSENTVDAVATNVLIEASKGKEFTFHRAFDWCVDPLVALQSLKELGVDRILSSGQHPKAIDGIELLKQLLSLSEGKIQIMPGSGVSHSNILDFKRAGFEMVHFSATVKEQVLGTPPKVSMHSPDLFKEGVIATTQQAEIAKVIALLR
ncbi:MAG: copper homeostasis protein CutC [Flavobacteriales bacterium]|jgi:copper homeostasis protein|uniref:copper homeostasis protein CutC n=1 Tax=Candidatus Ulvibacter alkanivorans TaxID=2267620 RepID=UPI000DF3E072|nr:copper homeostasis protein CutC [Candidatus Ulvibacter alkanivorans]MCH2489797.1 copper homeostasis protein CutC [Flavobacteriales bacterium]